MGETSDTLSLVADKEGEYYYYVIATNTNENANGKKAVSANSYSVLVRGYHTHKDLKWVVDTEPSCTATGREYYRCGECEANLEFRDIQVLEHDYSVHVMTVWGGSSTIQAGIHTWDTFGGRSLIGCTANGSETAILLAGTYYVHVYKNGGFSENFLDSRVGTVSVTIL